MLGIAPPSLFWGDRPGGRAAGGPRGRRAGLRRRRRRHRLVAQAAPGGEGEGEDEREHDGGKHEPDERLPEGKFGDVKLHYSRASTLYITERTLRRQTLYVECYTQAGDGKMPTLTEHLSRSKTALLAELAHEVSDPRVLNAIARVPRERFVPPELRLQAYENRPLPIGYGQTISPPPLPGGGLGGGPGGGPARLSARWRSWATQMWKCTSPARRSAGRTAPLTTRSSSPPAPPAYHSSSSSRCASAAGWGGRWAAAISRSWCGSCGARGGRASSTP